ncbi:FkbM family methyltransferase [Flavobacterium sp. SM15]|uniref:FkbM family methyltransferase n=1 Tax=Flavobacterium sp. SM15 TaxID=2908005 RepID=UPI001EDAC653|nr:FkbM family methyltransferase [Flavobacterium sp. SM15]MCG2611044.1 FkbM family methyltransferase [Flavobacterium sp. SM15]
MLKKVVLFKLLKKHFKFIDAFALLLGISNGKETIKLPKLKRTLFLRKNSKDLETFEEIFLTNLYNTPLPIKPKNIVDAGANVGLASLFFKLKYPQANIVAIEIEEKNAEMIKKNTAGLENFELWKNALYNKKAFFKIIDPYNATNSFQIKEVGASESYDIESVTIDEVLEKKQWETIDILKIDIEGAEKQLFEENYQAWLPKVKIIMVETHDRMIPKCSYTVMKTLNDYNYILFTTTEGTLIYYNLSHITLP